MGHFDSLAALQRYGHRRQTRREHQEVTAILHSIAQAAQAASPPPTTPCERCAPVPTQYQTGWADAWRMAQRLLARHGLTVAPGADGQPTLVQITAPIDGSAS